MYATTEKEGTRRRSQVDTIVEGIGINRVTANFEAGRELIDDAIKVDDEQALAMARWLVEKDGIFVGSSSAVNCRRNLTDTTYKRLTGKRRRCNENCTEARPWAYNCHYPLRFGSETYLKILGKSRKR